MSHESIKRKCVKDHAQFIKSYITHNLRNNITDNYDIGVKRYNQMKELMRDVTIHHPQFMSYMLDPYGSKTCTDNICETILSEQISNKSYQIGGNKQDLMKVLDNIKSVFEIIKNIDVGKMKTESENLIKELKRIEENLKFIVKENETIEDPNIVLNNMGAIITSLKNFDPTSKSYKKYKHAYDLYIPAAKFDEKNLKDVHNLSETSTKILTEYANVIGIGIDNQLLSIIESVLTSFNKEILEKKLKELEPLSSEYAKKIITNIGLRLVGNDFYKARSDIIDNIILNIFENVKTIPDPVKVKNINTRYTDVEKELDIKKNEIEKVTQSLISATDNTNKYLYGDPELQRNNFSAIRANILPKIRYIMLMIDLFLKYNKDNTYKKLFGMLLDKYNAIELLPGEKLSQNNISISKDTNNIVSVLNDYEKNKQKTIKTFVNECNSTNISRKILLYNEKVTSDSFVDFLEFYNKTINSAQPSIAKLDIFIAETYRQIIHDIKEGKTMPIAYETLKDSEAIKYYVGVIRKLNVKKVHELATSPSSDFTLFETLLHKSSEKDPSKQRELIKDALKKNLAFTKFLNDVITTDKDARIFTYEYNKAVHGLDKTGLVSLGLPSDLQLIPYAYFIRDYTERIYNNIFKNIDEHRIKKNDLLSDLVEASLGENTPGKNTPDMIYAPDFKKIKEIMQKQINRQIGGNNEQIDQIVRNMINLSNKKMEYMNSVSKYETAGERYMLAYNDVYSYTRYLILIATNQLFTDNYVVYNYLNRGLIELYKRIIKNIVKDLDTGGSEIHVIYIRKYYNVIVRRLYSFLDNLSTFITDSTDLIDIRNIDFTLPEIRNDVILLNYFKPVIESYNEMFQNQITIYARLNDIAGDIDYDSKVFVSDHEKYRVEGCGYDVLKNNPTPEQQKDVCDPSKTSNISMGGNSSIMWAREQACDALTQEKQEKQKKQDTLVDKSIVFTEVFDTVNFSENGDISKYMTLETQLAKKKGVCVLTYGYSGTGKTYTLFGGGPNNKLGVLQSTLVNINGLYKVKFRLFEIYGLGLPYDFYWNDPEKSRMNEIYHQIIHYRLETVDNAIKVVQGRTDDLVKINAADFSMYIEGKEDLKKLYNIDDTYVHIKGNSVKDVFSKFSNFTSSVDNYRKGALGKNNEIRKIKRIRETPNNPESSRSVLIYDFKLYIGEDTPIENDSDSVRFLIIDLPGREEINQTYIMPYLDNSHIKDLLNDKFVVEEIRMIITCMALNPMALAVFCYDDVFDVINNKTTKVQRQHIYDNITNYELNALETKLGDMIKIDADKFTASTIPYRGFGYMMVKKKENMKKVHGKSLMNLNR